MGWGITPGGIPVTGEAGGGIAVAVALAGVGELLGMSNTGGLAKRGGRGVGEFKEARVP